MLAPSNADEIFVATVAEFERLNNKKIVSLPSGAAVAVFKVGDNYHAIDNYCAHSRGELGLGDIEEIGENKELCIRCPKHQKKFGGGLYFSFETGCAGTKIWTPTLDPTWKVSTYAVKVSSNDIFVVTRPNNNVPPLFGKKGAVFTLSGVKEINHDSSVYSFALNMNPSDKNSKKATKKLLSVATKTANNIYHLDVKSASDAPCTQTPFVSREYTPINTMENFLTSRKYEILIKRYQDGLFSKTLLNSKVGDSFYFSSPKPSIPFKYLEPTPIASRPGIAFIVAGSGIAPVYQVLSKMESRIKASQPVHKLSVIFSNKTFQDILMFKELEEIVSKYPEHFNITYTITREKPPQDVATDRIFEGRVSEALISKFLPHEKNFHVLVCGPHGMWETCVPILKTLGYLEEECSELIA